MQLIAEKLACDRGGRRVFEGVSFSLGGGEALAVTGPNGVGKSSLLRVLAGLVRASEGETRIDGGEADFTVAEHCHYFGHLDALKPALSVLENLDFWRSFSAPARGLDGTHEAMQPMEALDTLGIGHTAHLPAAYLSAGQRRRLSLSRLLTVPRPVWLLDEPTSALDAASEAKLVELMSGHLNSGGMIVAATHQTLGLAAMRNLRMEAAQ